MYLSMPVLSTTVGVLVILVIFIVLYVSMLSLKIKNLNNRLIQMEQFADFARGRHNKFHKEAYLSSTLVQYNTLSVYELLTLMLKHLGLSIRKVKEVKSYYELVDAKDDDNEKVIDSTTGESGISGSIYLTSGTGEREDD